MRFRSVALALLALGSTLPVYAQQSGGSVQVPADGIIIARQAAYDLMGAVAGDMKRAVDAKVTDVKPYKAGAEAIGRWAKNVPAMFPTGTEQGQNTKALPAVWSDRTGFEKAAANLVSAADTLAKAADANDPAAFAQAFQATGAACGNCHKNYRAKQS